jgi:DNA topoisomerase-1
MDLSQPAWSYPGHRGRDARHRKQYRYHPRWRTVRDATKYDHLLLFGEAIPAIRRHVESDLAKPGLPREKVLAAVVRLMEMTLARVGNPEYARQNHSFGLTLLVGESDLSGSHLRQVDFVILVHVCNSKVPFQ